MNVFGDIKFRHFLSDKLMDKNVLVVNGRKLSAQKIAPMIKEYALLYNSDPVLDYESLKYNYTAFAEELKTKRNELKEKIGNGSEKYNKKDKPKKVYKYLHPNWRKLRLDVLERDNNTCVECGSKSNLHCHHEYYLSGFKIWQYPLSALKTLCKSCHDKFHDLHPGKTLVRIATKKEKKERIKNFPEVSGNYKKKKLTNCSKIKPSSLASQIKIERQKNKQLFDRYEALRERQLEYKKTINS